MADKPDHLRHGEPRSRNHAGGGAEVRDDAIVATGRSDYPNQINNVLGFPYIFRGALDVQARTINEPMKIAAANAIAELARADVPDEVATVYGRRLRYGRDYIIPAPFDPRLISAVPTAVAKAAMDSGVARRPIVDMEGYKSRLSARLDPAAGFINSIFDALRMRPEARRLRRGRGRAGGPRRERLRGLEPWQSDPDRARGKVRHAFHLTRREQPRQLRNRKRGVLRSITRTMRSSCISACSGKGYLYRDCVRLVNNDRNVFGACMVALGHADAMVTGVTRNWTTALRRCAARARSEAGAARHRRVASSSAAAGSIFVADTSIHDMPTAEELADIAVEAAGVASRFGIDAARGDARLLDLRPAARRALGAGPRGRQHPRPARRRFRVRRRDGSRCRAEPPRHGGLSVLPADPTPRTCSSCPPSTRPASRPRCCRSWAAARSSARCSSGLSKPVQIASLGSSDSDLVNMAALAAFDVTG